MTICLRRHFSLIKTVRTKANNKIFKPQSALKTADRAMQINYTYADIRQWLLHFRTLDYTKTKHRKDLIDTFIYRIVLYDDKVKILFHLKNGQKDELLLSLLFPDYPDGNDGDTEANDTKKETAEAISSSEGCAYTSRMVDSLLIQANTGSVKE